MMHAGLLLLLWAGDWSAPVEVRNDDTLCVTYRARLAGPHLLVEITPEPGWHTFSMDNKQRQTAALKGKMSLGSEKPTSVTLGAGAAVAGAWLQTEPEDFSKPEIQWYSYGYSKAALLAAPVKVSAAKTEITIRGQACTESICKNIDVTVPVDLRVAGPTADLSKLTPLR